MVGGENWRNFVDIENEVGAVWNVVGFEERESCYKEM